MEGSFEYSDVATITMSPTVKVLFKTELWPELTNHVSNIELRQSDCYVRYRSYHSPQIHLRCRPPFSLARAHPIHAKPTESTDPRLQNCSAS